jgi:hypothetical protein
MAGWLRVITAVAFAVHVMVGCCSHHAHAEECTHDAAPANTFSTPDGASLGHWAVHAEPVQSECQGQKCLFVRPTNDVLVDLLRQIDSVPSLALPSDGIASLLLASSRHSISQHFLSQHFFSQHFFSTGRLLMPIRLHLADQVLLN